jgi:hypothetical protein
VGKRAFLGKGAGVSEDKPCSPSDMEVTTKIQAGADRAWFTGVVRMESGAGASCRTKLSSGLEDRRGEAN